MGRMQDALAALGETSHGRSPGYRRQRVALPVSIGYDHLHWRYGESLPFEEGEARSMSARWATFDCYGTLIDWNRGIGDTFARLWPSAERNRLLRVYHAVEPLVEEGVALPYREVLRRALRAVAAIAGLALDESDADALGNSLSTWPAFPDVPAALWSLRESGWRLAILSNTDPDLLAASQRQIGVPIDLAITAADAGSYKPAPGHWDRFFERTGADRARHVHVAASLFHDIAPAHHLGLRAVWINRLGERSDLPRAAELPDLSRLPKTLARLVPA
jgi:2-haloacid dehalogenase